MEDSQAEVKKDAALQNSQATDQVLHLMSVSPVTNLWDNTC